MLALSVPRGGVTELAYLPDGRTLLTGDGTGRVLAWDLPSQQSELLFEIRGGAHDKAIQSLCCSVDGRWVAAGSWNGVIVWDRTTATTRAPADPDQGEAAAPRPHWPVVLTPDGTGLLGIGYSRVRTVCYWDLTGRASPHLLPAESGYVSNLALSPDGQTFVSTWYRYVQPNHRWLVRVSKLPEDSAITELVEQVETNLATFTLDGALLATAGGLSVRIWDTTTWRQLAKIKHGKAHGRVHVRRTAFHPSGSLLATAGDAPLVTFWDTSTGKEQTRFDWSIGRILSLAFSPDGLTCAAGGSNRKLVIWDVEL